MAAPSGDEIRALIEQHVALWNAGDKEAWLAAWQAAVPGGASMEDPVGTPVKRGWDLLAEAWDASPNQDWKLSIDRLIVCGNEGAAVIRNEGSVQGTPITVVSIEVYQFGDDGSVHTKTYWEAPEGGSDYAEWTASTS
jgi:SnoaL-like protein